MIFLTQITAALAYFMLSSDYTYKLISEMRTLISIHNGLEQSFKTFKFITVLKDVCSFFNIQFITFFNDFADFIFKLDNLTPEILIKGSRQIHKISNCLFYLFWLKFFFLLTTKINIVENIINLLFDLIVLLVYLFSTLLTN